MPPLAVDGTELSQEMQAMKFEWTPQLKEILAQGPKIHPYIGPGYERGNPVYQEYKPGMPLPDPADPSMFLQWCGLNDETIRKLSDNFFEEKKDLIAQTPNRGYISKWIPAGWHKIHFPVLEGLVDTYVRSLGKLDFDFEESYGKEALYSFHVLT